MMRSHPCSFPVLARRGWLTLCLGGSLAFLPGCVLPEAGSAPEVAAYARGDLEANLATDYDQVIEAARGALRDLEFPKVSENQDAGKAVLVSRTATDKPVELTITNSGKKLTSIKIRVGVFGDEELSRVVLEKIKARL
jgi:hypothetical protein